MKRKEEGYWRVGRSVLFRTRLRRFCPPSLAGISCASKECKPAVILCNTCSFPSRVYYCADCDLLIHGAAGIHDHASMIHDRDIEDTTMKDRPFMQKLGPTEFLLEEEEEGGYKRGARRLCLMPHFDNVRCGDVECNAQGRPPSFYSEPVEDIGQKDIVVVITMHGRFQFTKGQFVCNYCGWKRLHAVDDDYGALFPGSCNTESSSYQFKVSTETLDFYNTLLSNNPQSLEGFVNTLNERTKDGNRTGTISYDQFRAALIEYNKLTSDVRTICKLTPNACPCCPETDRTADIVDGNMKCFRYDRDKELDRETHYTDSGRRLFVPDAVRDEYFRVIYGPDGKNKDTVDNTCGSTQFVAMSADEMKSKQKDEHGVFFRACDHMVLNCACNIHHGEAYGVHALLHHYAAEPGVIRRVDVHTSDICCKTVKWGRDMEARVGDLLSQLEGINMSPSFNDITPVLNAMHQRGHVWYCQILFGRAFVEGSMNKDRELLERAFGQLVSRLGKITKEMGKAGRIDMITECVAAFNKRVVDKLLHTLQKDFNAYEGKLEIAMSALSKSWSKSRSETIATGGYVDGDDRGHGDTDLHMPDISLFVDEGNGVGCDVSAEAKNMLNKLTETLISTAEAASKRCHFTVNDKKEAQYIHLFTLETEIGEKLSSMMEFDPESTIYCSSGFSEFMQMANKLVNNRQKNTEKRLRLRDELTIKYKDELDSYNAPHIMPEADFVALIKKISAKINLEQVQIDIEGHAHAYKHAQTAQQAGSTSSRDQNRHRETMKVNKKKLTKSVQLYNTIRNKDRDVDSEDVLSVDGVLSGDLTLIPWVRDHCMVNKGGLFALRHIKLAEAWGTVLRLREQPAAFQRWMTNYKDHYKIHGDQLDAALLELDAVAIQQGEHGDSATTPSDSYVLSGRVIAHDGVALGGARALMFERLNTISLKGER